MELQGGLGKKNIKEAISTFPGIGEIIERYGIGCSKCSIGTCLLKDVVTVHFLGAESEAGVEKEINNYLASNTGPPPA
ncbi:MAG: hypothetical protein HGA96_12895 [Desulfobulbaceae bacterium]|nr:hypothetical protein [Desulfobulbaceae bacterium]